MQRLLRQFAAHTVLLSCQLDAASPDATLKRGFALIDDGSSRIRSVDDVQVGNQINIRVTNGVIEAEVKRCRIR